MGRVAAQSDVDIDEVASTVAASTEGNINPEYGIKSGEPYGARAPPQGTAGLPRGHRVRSASKCRCSPA